MRSHLQLRGVNRFAQHSLPRLHDQPGKRRCIRIGPDCATANPIPQNLKFDRIATKPQAALMNHLRRRLLQDQAGVRILQINPPLIDAAHERGMVCRGVFSAQR
jgi:hypothetical protein